MENPSDTPDCLLAAEIVQKANELVARLQTARVGIARLEGRLEEAGQRRADGPRVENHFYSDRATTIRDSDLPDASIQMQVLKKTSDNNIDPY